MKSLNSNLLLLVIILSACASASTTNADPANCEQLDLEAVKLAGENKLQEASQVFDRALTECPESPTRMTSRGVLYAAMGEQAKAEAIINDAILLAERKGDQCRADMSRAELATLKGGPKLESLPKSCKSNAR